MIIAITGGTGFVGRYTIDQALSAGHQVRVLTRQPQRKRDGIAWIEGALDDAPALHRLVDGAEAVIHIAGVVNARGRAGFVTGNVEGTRAIVAAARGRRFVHVSSLSAREPQLSDYGWSKREAERLVQVSEAEWTIVRPTGVYGPRDTELRDMFRLAKRGLALLPPPGMVALVHVRDLARLLVTLVQHPGTRAIYEVDDGTVLTHAGLAHAIGTAVGQKVLSIHLTAPLLRLGAQLDRVFRGQQAKLTPDRVGYLCHPDWTARADHRPPPDLWTPEIPIALGLRETAAWYRAQRLL